MIAVLYGAILGAAVALALLIVKGRLGGRYGRPGLLTAAAIITPMVIGLLLLPVQLLAGSTGLFAGWWTSAAAATSWAITGRRWRPVLLLGWWVVTLAVATWLAGYPIAADYASVHGQPMTTRLVMTLGAPFTVLVACAAALHLAATRRSHRRRRDAQQAAAERAEQGPGNRAQRRRSLIRGQLSNRQGR